MAGRGYHRVQSPDGMSPVLLFIPLPMSIKRIETVVLAADLAGTAVFALEGALAAMHRGLDLLGVMVLSFVVALGGGVIRDLLIGATPPNAVRDWRYPVLAFVTGLLTFVFHGAACELPALLVTTLDAAGLALFAVAGAQKALNFGIGPFIATLMGTLTGVGGGAIRDLCLRACRSFWSLIFMRVRHSSAVLRSSPRDASACHRSRLHCSVARSASCCACLLRRMAGNCRRQRCRSARGRAANLARAVNRVRDARRARCRLSIPATSRPAAQARMHTGFCSELKPAQLPAQILRTSGTRHGERLKRGPLFHSPALPRLLRSGAGRQSGMKRHS